MHPAVEFCADGVTIKIFVDPVLNAGVWPKLEPPLEGAFTAGMAGLAAGVDKAGDSALKADWNPPGPVEAAADPNVGAGLGF